MGTTVDQVASWLEDVTGQEPRGFDLRRRTDGMRVQRWKWEEGIMVADFASKVLKSAQRDGSGQFQKLVGYNLRAEAEAFGEEGLGTLQLYVDGATQKGKVEGSDDLEVSASFHGVVVHLLKQNGELHRQLIASNEGRTLALERQNESLAKQLGDAEKRHVQLVMLTDTLAMAKMEREIEMRRANLEESRLKFASEKLDRYIPIALNRLLGGGPGKGSPMADEIWEQLLGNMGKERIEALMEGKPVSLSEDERMMFAELYMSQASKHDARQSRRRHLNVIDGGKSEGETAAAAGDEKKEQST